MLVFRPPLATSAPLTFTLVHLPPSPLPCVNKYTGVHEFIQCVTGGGGIGGLRQINTCRPVPLLGNFKKSRHLGFGVFIDILGYFAHIFLTADSFIGSRLCVQQYNMYCLKLFRRPTECSCIYCRCLYWYEGVLPGQVIRKQIWIRLTTLLLGVDPRSSSITLEDVDQRVFHVSQRTRLSRSRVI